MKYLILLPSLFMLLLSPGCSSRAKPSDSESNSLQNSPSLRPQDLQGSIEIWGWNIAAKSLLSLVEAFNQRYPKVSVNVDMTGANMQTRFLLSLSAGVGAPDVSQLQQVDAPKYIATERLTDLTSVASQYESMFPSAIWKNCTYKGKVYAIPWDIGPCAVYFKRGLFEKYNLDPTTIETWEDYISMGKALVENSGSKTKMLPLSTGSLWSMFEMLIQQNGGQIFDDEGRIALHSAQCEQAIRVIQGCLESGISANVETWGHEFMAGLKSDTIATYPMAVWFGGTIKDTVKEYAGQKTDWGVFRWPAYEPGGLRTSNLGGSVLVIPDQCPNKPAAWAFIEYALCTREGQLPQYQRYDLFPAFLPTLDDPYFDQPDPFFSQQQASRLFATDITRLPALNRTKDWMEAVRYIDQALSKWASSGMKDEDPLATVSQKLQRRLGRELSPQSLSGGA